LTGNLCKLVYNCKAKSGHFAALCECFIVPFHHTVHVGTVSSLCSSYPMMIYDTLPMGGASQFHPHAHGFLASEYLGHMAVQHSAALKYEDENGSEYWSDLIEAHHALGLSVMLGDAIAISPLVCHVKTNIPVTKMLKKLLFRINFKWSPALYFISDWMYSVMPLLSAGIVHILCYVQSQEKLLP